MAVAQTEVALDARAPDFRLPATDGRTYALKEVAGQKGTVICLSQIPDCAGDIVAERLEGLALDAQTFDVGVLSRGLQSKTCSRKQSHSTIGRKINSINGLPVQATAKRAEGGHSSQPEGD
jgi:hypothetical protein